MNAATIACLAAAVLASVAVAPSEARARLLDEGSRPPAFALPDSAGRAVSLKSFLGPRRIVLLFAPTRSYLDAVRRERDQFADRDLTVLAILPPGSALAKEADTAPVQTLLDQGDDVARVYGAADGQPAFYLIGKDGHIAMARRNYPSTAELFAVIDAMPMRRAEMRERHK